MALEIGIKGIPSSQSRQLLASINVSHSPVPVLLTHTEFQKLFVLKDHDTVHMKKAPTLCPLERFFGSVMLRAHLLRVLRTDETLKLEKNDHGVVVFSGAGKNGPETGLQYSVRLNQATMDSLLLKVTPMKGHESDWDCEDLRVLEHFFENKVVCPPYKICALTAFVRILGTYPKIMKDFIKIMRLELQTDWSKLLFKVEWCLIIPPSDIPSPALPGTPGVVLKNKNLIFLQLTEVKNEEHTVTVAILHDLKTNIVQHLDFPKHNSTQQQERETWAVKARNCFHNTLHRIQKGISQKEYPVYCAVYTVLMKMEVK